MAYTYDDFTSAATKAGLLDKFSAADLETAKRNPEFGLSILSLMQDRVNATTGEQKMLADEAANQLRKTYGSYVQDASGGNTYSGYAGKIDETLGKIESYGSFSYDNADDYNKLLQAVTNPDAFSYDPESDPVFSSYKKTYQREGERAAADTLAKAAAATGGIPSSYAVGAAQQAANYYSAGLADVVPTLFQNAYSRYLNDFGMKQSGLSALENDRAFRYSDWLNGYDMLQTLLGNYQTQDATDYSKYLNMLEQINTQDQQKFNNALALYQTLGYATPEVAAILGIKDGKKIDSGTGNPAGNPTGNATGDPVGNPTLDFSGKANNGRVSLENILLMQNDLGVDTDGKWGPATREAAYAKYGTTNPDVAWAKMAGKLKPSFATESTTTEVGNTGKYVTTYSQVIADIQSLRNAGRVGEIEALIDSAAPSLTQSEYLRLMDMYQRGMI